MIKLLTITLFSLSFLQVKAQLYSADELDTLTVYSDLNVALKNPDIVYSLDLSKQKLTEFPREIFRFKNLNVLKLNKNKIEQLPDSIFVFKYLQELDLSKNKFTEIHDSIYGFNHLKKLNLSDNKIEIISYKIANLNKLEELYIWGLPITKLPQEIYDLTELVFLDIRQIYFTPSERDYIRENLPNTEVKISNVCDCGN